MRARVFVTLKPSVFDPQGTTVAEPLHTLGYASIRDVRQGKYFEIDIDTADAGEARRVASEAADRLLANPVIRATGSRLWRAAQPVLQEPGHEIRRRGLPRLSP